ncbi:unnamed protein product [Choristocarpus tenellus]
MGASAFTTLVRPVRMLNEWEMRALHDQVRVLRPQLSVRCERGKACPSMRIAGDEQVIGENDVGAVNMPLSRREFGLSLASGAAGLLGLPLTSMGQEGTESVVEVQEETATAAKTVPVATAPSVVVGARDQNFQVQYTGKTLPLNKFLGKATLVVNPKIDDPESLNQVLRHQ